ncbi:hypothetical protein ABZ746_23615 [Streptomyces sp. NPDC020096]
MSVVFRIRCCLCGRNIPLAQDIYELDAEWQRRFPDMVGTFACARCALDTYWSCEQRGTGTYVDGHISAAEGRCFDSWSHIGHEGTQRAMVQVCPRSALLQGGEPYLRSLATRNGVRPEVAAAVGAVLRQIPGAKSR